MGLDLECVAYAVYSNTEQNGTRMTEKNNFVDKCISSLTAHFICLTEDLRRMDISLKSKLVQSLKQPISLTVTEQEAPSVTFGRWLTL